MLHKEKHAAFLFYASSIKANRVKIVYIHGSYPQKNINLLRYHHHFSIHLRKTHFALTQAFTEA